MSDDYRIITPQQWNELRYRVAELANKILSNPEIATHCTSFALGIAHRYLQVGQTTEDNFDELETAERFLRSALHHATQAIAYSLVIPRLGITGSANVELQSLTVKATGVHTTLTGGSINPSGSLEVIHIRAVGISSGEGFGTPIVGVQDTAVVTETIRIYKQDEPHNLRWEANERQLRRIFERRNINPGPLLTYLSFLSLTERQTEFEQIVRLDQWLTENPARIWSYGALIISHSVISNQFWQLIQPQLLIPNPESQSDERAALAELQAVSEARLRRMGLSTRQTEVAVHLLNGLQNDSEIAKAMQNSVKPGRVRQIRDEIAEKLRLEGWQQAHGELAKELSKRLAFGFPNANLL